jgi:Flp pilus assembly protein TadG
VEREESRRASGQATRKGQGESGQATIEFALTISITLLLIFALIDFSRAMYTVSVLQWAAQNGARAAIIEPSQTAVETAVKERLVGLDPDAVVVEPISWTGTVVQVEIRYPFEFVAPVVAQITGESIEMSSSASMIAH